MKQRLNTFLPFLTGQSRVVWNPLRVISLSCMLLMVMGLVAACGSNQSGSSTTSNGKTVITEMDYWPNAPTGPVVDQLFRTYQQQHPNIEIRRDAVPFGSLLSKADQEAASHTLPNLLMLDNPDVANFALTGALVPLDSYLQGTYNQSDFFSGPLSTMRYNGKIYAFSVGNNDLALFYNKKMFADAHLTPPATWDQLYADAKALTHNGVYGFAFSAPATEEATWQFEPFFWTNQGDFAHIDSTSGVASLEFLTKMVHDGIASHAVLNWGQGDVATQFGEGHAAIMENGPWNFPLLSQQYHMQFDKDYGVVPIPVPQSGVQPVVPLGGETWSITINGNAATQKATWDLINWLEQPQQLLEFDKSIGYIPAIKSTAQTLLQSEPYMKVFVDELNTAEARTAKLGTKYPAVSQAVWTAEQAALSGSQSPQQALSQAQQRINTIVGNGG